MVLKILIGNQCIVVDYGASCDCRLVFDGFDVALFFAIIIH